MSALDFNVDLVKGFKVLPVKFNAKSFAVQQLFLKPHNVRNPHPEKPNDSTLFVINLSDYVDEACLRRLLGECGRIERVYFHQKPTPDVPSTETKISGGYKVAYVVFSDPEHVQNAMKLDSAKERLLFDAPDNQPLLGIKKWCKEYNERYSDPVERKKEIDAFMTRYDQKVKEKIEQEKAMEGVADEDGWVTVTKHGRKAAVSRSEGRINKIHSREKQKKTQKELQNFYTFQIRETKMDHIVQLRKKFEDDKQRIALLKASRKFRPF